jgi:hypothetical protein
MTLLSYHLIDMILLKLSDLNTSIQLYRTYIAKKLITTILLNNKYDTYTDIAIKNGNLNFDLV